MRAPGGWLHRAGPGGDEKRGGEDRRAAPGRAGCAGMSGATVLGPQRLPAGGMGAPDQIRFRKMAQGIVGAVEGDHRGGKSGSGELVTTPGGKIKQVKESKLQRPPRTQGH